MSSLFGVIAEYKDDLTMLPIMILLFVLLTILCYIFFNKHSFVKYIPALFGIIVGTIYLLLGIKNITEPTTFSLLWKGIYFFVAGCIALGSAWIMALLTQIFDSTDLGKKKNPLDSKQRPKKKSVLSDKTKLIDTNWGRE